MNTLKRGDMVIQVKYIYLATFRPTQRPSYPFRPHGSLETLFLNINISLELPYHLVLISSFNFKQQQIFKKWMNNKWNYFCEKRRLNLCEVSSSENALDFFWLLLFWLLPMGVQFGAVPLLPGKAGTKPIPCRKNLNEIANFSGASTITSLTFSTSSRGQLASVSGCDERDMISAW